MILHIKARVDERKVSSQLLLPAQGIRSRSHCPLQIKPWKVLPCLSLRPLSSWSPLHPTQEMDMLYHGPASEIFVTKLPPLWGSLGDTGLLAPG